MHYKSEGFNFFLLTFWTDLSVSPSTSTIRGGDRGRGTLQEKTDGGEVVRGQGGLVTVMTVGSSGGGGTYGFHPGGGGGTDTPNGRGGGPRLMLTSLSLSDDIHGE